MTLHDYLKKHKVSVVEFAAMIGVSSESVYRYMVGSRRPTWKVMEKIAQTTDGKVTANSFFAQSHPVSRRVHAA